MTTTQKIIAAPVLAGLILGSGALAGYAAMASADDAGTGTVAGFMQGMRSPHVDGTISAINGSTITISADERHGGDTYIIDASGATFMKDGESASIADFVVGDSLWAAGTINGTQVTADKVTNRPAFGKGGRGGPGHGRGPGVAGEVTAINGTTLTVTGPDGTSYTVDAGSATVQKMVTGSLSDIAIGDRIGVKGAVSDTNVVAETIMDDLPEMPHQTQN